MVFGLVFDRYVERRIRLDRNEHHQNSLGYTMLKLVKKKLSIRLTLTCLGSAIIISFQIINYTY
jgi:hypothetical protein